MAGLSNFRGAGEPEKVTRARSSLCPTCGQPVPEAGPEARPEWEPPESVAVLSARIHERLRETFADFKYHIWLRPLRLMWREGNHLTFAAPEHIRTSFEERYLSVVLRLLRESGWGSVTGEVVGETWKPSPEQLAAGPATAPGPAEPRMSAPPAVEAARAAPPEAPAPARRGALANAPHRAMERTAEALLHEAAADMKPETVEMLEDAVERSREAQKKPAGQPTRRRRSDVPR